MAEFDQGDLYPPQSRTGFEIVTKCLKIAFSDLFFLSGYSIQIPQDPRLRVPPIKEQKVSGEIVRYDSVQGLSGASLIHIVYELDKAYPAYLITYSV